MGDFMIITCPNCKTEFQVDDTLISNGKNKFQCAECAFIWSLPDNNPNHHSSFSIDIDEKKKLLHGLGVEEFKSEKSFKWYNRFFQSKNILVFLLGLVLFFIIFMLFNFIYNYNFNNNSSDNQSIFDKQEKSIDTSKLYIELARPLTLIREGANDYVIIRGFIYNPSNVVLPIPKLIIRLENQDGRLLQEQEREIDLKQLEPLEKTDFMFKVFRFSDQVASVRVEFIDTDKI